MRAAPKGIIRWGTLLFFATGLAACSGGGSSPSNINDDGFKRHGELRVNLSDTQVREGDSVAVSASLVGGTGFDPSRVQWSVMPSHAGTVRNGYFVASWYGDATLQASFSGTQGTTDARILPAPRALAPVGADFRAGTAGLQLPDSVQVRVTGRDGVAVPDFDVQFQVTTGGGDVSSSMARTDAQGRVSVAWTLGAAAGRNELKAIIPNVGEARVEAEGYADLSSAEVDLLNGNEQQGQVAEVLPDPLAVRVNDVNGNPIRGITVEWIFDGDGSETGLFDTPPTDRTVIRGVTDAGGVSRMYWRLGTHAGDQLGSAIMIASSAAPGNGNGNGNGNNRTEFNAKARPGHLENITITPDQAEIEVDGSTTLTATATDKWGNEVEVPLEWAVSDAEIATVADGVVQGSFPGQVSVSASSGSTEDHAEVRVLTGAPSHVLATGSGQSAVISQKLAEPLVAQVTDEHGAAIAGVTVSWSVVAGGGSLSSQTTQTDADGRASVEWTLGGATGEQEVQAGVQSLEPVSYSATAIEPVVASITVSPTSLSFLEGGQAQTLTATARDASGNTITAAIEWSTSNPGVATVDNSGAVTPIAAGQAQIRASSSGVTGTADVTVSVDNGPGDGDGGVDPEPDPTVASVQASHASHTFTALGKTQQFSATALDGNGDPLTGITFTWSSSKTDVASVDVSGKVTAKAVGIASIIVCASACSAADTITVTVEQIASTVTASPTTVSLTVGETKQLSAVVKDSEDYTISDAEVEWTTTNASVATISSSGLVTAVDEGSVKFQAKSGSAIVDVSGTMQGEGEGETLPTGDPFFVESFSSGDLSNTMGGFSWGSPNRTKVVDWFSRDAGGHSLRFRYPGGEAGTDSHAEQRYSIGRNLSEYWLEFWIYFPDGLEAEEGLFPEGFSSAKFQIRSGDGPSNMKIFRAWDGKYSADNKHGASIWQSGSGEPNARWGFESTRSSGSMGLITENPRIDPFLNETIGPVRHGEWAQLRLHIKFSSNADDTADGGADGVVEFWINGQLVASRYDQPLHGDIAGNGYNSWVSVGYFMGWANSGFDEETYVFIDDIAFYDSNPGW